jgi:hypothetical protein
MGGYPGSLENEEQERIVMKIILRLMLASMLAFVAAPAFAASAVQIFRCSEGDNADEEKIEAAASKWLKGARTMKGGANMKVHILYPSAANLAEGDLLIVLTAPSHADWGAFWDSYKDSPAEKADMESRDVIICPDSNLFELVSIE